MWILSRPLFWIPYFKNSTQYIQIYVVQDYVKKKKGMLNNVTSIFDVIWIEIFNNVSKVDINISIPLINPTTMKIFNVSSNFKTKFVFAVNKSQYDLSI